jgi:cobalamin biosynthesis protein CobT
MFNEEVCCLFGSQGTTKRSRKIVTSSTTIAPVIPDSTPAYRFSLEDLVKILEQPLPSDGSEAVNEDKEKADVIIVDLVESSSVAEKEKAIEEPIKSESTEATKVEIENTEQEEETTESSEDSTESDTESNEETSPENTELSNAIDSTATTKKYNYKKKYPKKKV